MSIQFYSCLAFFVKSFTKINTKPQDKIFFLSKEKKDEV